MGRDKAELAGGFISTRLPSALRHDRRRSPSPCHPTLAFDIDIVRFLTYLPEGYAQPSISKPTASTTSLRQLIQAENSSRHGDLQDDSSQRQQAVLHCTQRAATTKVKRILAILSVVPSNARAGTVIF